MSIFGNQSAVFSIYEIEKLYPEQWVAMAVTATDDDGLAVAGQVLLHGVNEQTVWGAVRLGEEEDLIYVFHTGPRKAAVEAA